MIRLIAILTVVATTTNAQVKKHLPNGLMLNMDFEQVEGGLIPSKTLYPLFVPQGGLGIELFNYRKMLAFQYGQGLDIPHSSLLDPNGSEWIVSVRAFPLTDGIIVSQNNEQHGYAIYMKDGHIYATIRSGHSAFTLKEAENRGRTKYTKRWVTIELRIKRGMAIMTLNRKRVSMVGEEPALDGENLRIRLGNHNTSPALFKNTDVPATGFTGAISSFKIFRQGKTRKTQRR
jgi:hypothetical protein